MTVLLSKNISNLKYLQCGSDITKIVDGTLQTRFNIHVEKYCQVELSTLNCLSWEVTVPELGC